MTSIPVAVSLKCTSTGSDGEKIEGPLNRFLNKASKGLGDTFDMVAELDTAVSEISDAMSGLTSKMSNLLQNKLGEFVNSGLTAAKNFIFNKFSFNPLAAIAQNKAFANAMKGPVEGLMGAFGCLGSTIKKALKGTIKNLLTNMLKNGFINPLECAVEDFIGAMTSKVSSMMDSIVGPLIGPINSMFSLIGKGFGSVKGFLAKGLNILTKVQGLLNCKESGTECTIQNEYTLHGGSKKPNSGAKSQNKIAKAINRMGDKLQNNEGTGLVGKMNKKIKNWNGEERVDENGDPFTPDCNTGNIFDCGLPRIEFFGGGGEGAVGDVILGNFVNELDNAIDDTEITDMQGNTTTIGAKTTGSIIGVDILFPGEGYTEEPIVSFVDNCDKGYGAYGRATIDKDPNSPTFGQITGILMISEGENYPTGEISDAYVDRIVVENGGSGYTMEDEIEDFEVCGIDENGAITKVCTNDKPYQSLPSLNVNSLTGSGAILTPVMTRKPRKTGVINVIDCITPRGNIVGYVNGKEYNGPFHVMPNGLKMTGLEHSDRDTIIYGTPQESLRSGGSPASNVGSTRIGLRSIQALVQESESTQSETPQTTENTDLYSDPVDTTPDSGSSPPPSSPPPSSPPPSSPPSSGSSGGGYGY